MELPRYNVLGVGIHAVNLPTATEYLVRAARAEHQGYVCCCDAHSVTQARRRPDHRRTLNGALLATPDGMPLVWAGRRQGYPEVGRTYGPDLMEAVCAATAGTELTHYFFGGSTGVAADLSRQLSDRFPGLKIAGTESPGWSEDVRDLPTDNIRKAGAHFVWIGLSTPKQEAFMEHYHRGGRHPGITLGVGAAFDFLSGRVRQAPASWQRTGMEWLWRLGQEPRRLLPRYCLTVPSFAARMLAQRIGLKRYPIEKS